MRDEIKKIKGTVQDWLNFGAGVGILIVVISGIKFWKSDEEFWLYMGFGGAALVAAAVVSPRMFSFFWRIWMILALLIGWLMTRVLLTVSFFLALTPTALLLRLIGKQMLMLNADSGLATYWEKRPPQNADTIRERYEQQF